MFVPRSRFVELLMSDDADSIGSPANVHDDAAARCQPIARSWRERPSNWRTATPFTSTAAGRASACGSIRANGRQALASSHLIEHLDEFWTLEWRSRQRQEHERAAHEDRVKKELGADLYAQLCALAASLRDHPRRSQALAIIRELSSRSRD